MTKSDKGSVFSRPPLRFSAGPEPLLDFSVIRPGLIALQSCFSQPSLVTNAGIKDLSPAFSLTLVGLPEWLKRDEHYGFTASTGMLCLTGTPPKNGTAKITITAANEFGTAQPAVLTITVADKGKGLKAAP